MSARLHRQRGVAVITALLLTTLAITIVASLFWQQQVQVRSMENQRLQLQVKWILRGALDWARLILTEDAKYTSSADHLGEPWSVKLAETRLDDYVERERDDGDATDATLSGYIVDAQSRYNLGNLALLNEQGQKEAAKFRTLLTLLNQRPELADRLAAVFQAGNAPPGVPRTAAAALPLQQLDDLLAVPGFTPDVLEALREYVVLLPEKGTRAITTVNVNTASAEVIAAVTGLPLPDAQRQVARQKTAYFRDVNDFQTSVGRALPDSTGIDVKSDYFFVHGRVKLDRAGLQTLALLWRHDNRTDVEWIREI